MNLNKLLFTLILFLIIIKINAQNKSQCVHCSMNIQDEFHIATAVNDNETLQFDAIECLINYLKIHNENDFSSLKVANYSTGKLTDAKKATYLKSKAIKSPMGADLSAFSNRNDALKVKNKKGGDIYTWEEIIVKFKDSSFGAIDHHSLHDHYRPDAHSPIGVMGDHLHPKGGLMLSLRYMNMAMDGNKSGKDDIDNVSIYNNFVVAPQKMTMEMYMIGLMFAPSDKLTFMVMQNIVKKDMDLTAQMMMNGMPMLVDFSTSSSGFGDLKIGALYSLFNNHKTFFHLNGSLNIPVGEIQQRDDTPMIDDAKLPYTMQLGSGTVDVTLGATYKESYQNLSWGTQFLSTLRTGKNREDYRFGDKHQLNIWGAYRLSQNISVSARILGVTESKITGADPQLNPMIVTTANTNNYGSDKIKSFIGLNIAFPETSDLNDFRIGVEAGVPIHEDYNGIQMNENLSINIGLKYDVL